MAWFWIIVCTGAGFTLGGPCGATVGLVIGCAIAHSSNDGQPEDDGPPEVERRYIDDGSPEVESRHVDNEDTFDRDHWSYDPCPTSDEPDGIDCANPQPYDSNWDEDFEPYDDGLNDY